MDPASRMLVFASVAAAMRRRRTDRSIDPPNPNPSYANSTFTPASATGTADGSTPVVHTLTLRNGDNQLMTSTAVTFVIGDGLVNAGETSLACDVTGIDATTGVANLTLVVRNAAGVVLPNIQTARIVFAYTGSGETFTPVDSATDKNGVYRATFSSTAAEAAQTISVTVDGVAITDTVPIDVTGDAPTPPTLEFDSLWDAATGAGSTAISDGGIWTTVSNNTDTREGLLVAAASGTDPFVTNALEVRYRTASSGFAFLRVAGLAVPAATASKWYRAAFRQRYTQNQVLNTPHPIQDASAQGGTNWMFMIPPATVTATTWRPEFRTGPLVNPGHYQWLGPVLTIETWYLFEWQVHRLDATTFNLHVRVRNTDGTLIASDADFVNMADAGESLANNPVLTFNNVANLDGLNAGNNGITVGSSPITDEGPLFDQAAIATSNGNWIGVPA